MSSTLWINEALKHAQRWVCWRALTYYLQHRNIRNHKKSKCKGLYLHTTTVTVVIFLGTKPQCQNANAKDPNTKNANPNPKTPTPKHKGLWYFIHWHFVRGFQTRYPSQQPFKFWMACVLQVVDVQRSVHVLLTH